MNRSNNKSSHPLLIIDVLAFAIFGICLGFINMKWLSKNVPGASTLQFSLCIPTFFFLITGFIFYIYLEHKYNHLKLKNVFLYLAIVIAVMNIIAISVLPNEVILPNGAEPLIITPMDRTYYLLIGFAFGLIPYFFFYLIPRKILNRRYMNILLYIVIGAATLCILLSFIVEWRNYAGMISNRFVDIEQYALQSILGQKNNFGRMLLFGIFASILLRIRKKDARWILFFIPFYLFMLLTFSKLSIVVATITILAYFVIRLVMIAKKNRDNLVITLMIVGLVVILSPLLIVSIARSESGLLFQIKNAFVKFGESTQTTFSSRLIIWRCAFDLLKPYQYIFGFGIGPFDFALHNTYVPVAPEWEYLPGIWQAHNAYVEFIGRGGIVLLGIYIFLCGYLVNIALKLRKKTPWLSFATIAYLVITLLMGIVEPVYICGDDRILCLSLVTVLPIMSEYFLLMDENEIMVKKEIVNESKTINKINFKNKLLALNKKRLILEAKYIAYDLNNKIRL